MLALSEVNTTLGLIFCSFVGQGSACVCVQESNCHSPYQQRGSASFSVECEGNCLHLISFVAGDNSSVLPSLPVVCFAGRKLPGHSRLLVADWSEEDVQTWLCEEGLQELVSVFKANNIDGAELSQLNKETATELGIGEDGIQNTVTNISGQHTVTLSGTLGFSVFVGIYCSILKHDKLEWNSMT